MAIAARSTTGGVQVIKALVSMLESVGYHIVQTVYVVDGGGELRNVV